MKLRIAIFSVLISTTSFSPMSELSIYNCYSSDYVEISDVKHKNEIYSIVTMRRDSNRINAKYFAAKDFNGKSVYNRYLDWKRYNPKVVLVSSGTYFDDNSEPQGLTIDSGVIVNEALIYDKMDALTIVYATGGIVVSDLKVGDLTVSGINRKLNIRKNPRDFDDFINWAVREEATVFQTHLLVFKNELRVRYGTSSNRARERRFLAVGKDRLGKTLHVIVHNPVHTTLYEGSRKVLQFLQEYKEMEVIFMINLDTGAQDVFELYNPDCTINATIRGQLKPSEAVNLLVYYFK